MEAFISSVIAQLQAIFDPSLLGKQCAVLLEKAILFSAIFAAFYFLWKALQFFVRSMVRRAQFDRTASAFIEKAIKYAILAFATVEALNTVGVNTSAVLASLGIAGLTIGFAARDALSNVISGIIIFLDRPFVIGDMVEVEGHYGKVDSITLRSTRIITSDGKMLAVPNTEIVNKTVTSYTNAPHLRLDIAVSVAVTEDLGRARQVLLGIVRDDPDYLGDPLPRVVVTQLNDYNVMLEIQAWIRDERIHVEKRFQLREQIFNALNSAGVVMPFETLQLTPLEVKLLDAAGTVSQRVP